MYMLRTFHPMFQCICMYVMSGLRLSDLNKETTYLLTLLLNIIHLNTIKNNVEGKCLIFRKNIKK